MANAKTKLYYTSSKYINDLPITNGNIIFVPDANMFCLDMSDQRFSYTTIKTFATDAERLATPFLNEGFYFVEESKVFWRWKNGWSQLTPSGLKPVVYGMTIEDLPPIGEPETLYYTDSGIYHWKDNKYNLIGNVNTWDVL